MALCPDCLRYDDSLTAPAHGRPQRGNLIAMIAGPQPKEESDEHALCSQDHYVERAAMRAVCVSLRWQSATRAFMSADAVPAELLADFEQHYLDAAALMRSALNAKNTKEESNANG